jgi:predicted adenine nucleotide alpha hydrolase (AANH) superfamily ATPase
LINGLEITKKLALHVCCAPCASYPVELLKTEYKIYGFYSNSNIYPQEEYRQRIESFNKLCGLTGISGHIDNYDPDSWSRLVCGLENEPEKGRRCAVCIYSRLKKTFDFSRENNIENVGTVLTVAPYKDSGMIFDIGEKLSQEYGINFLKIDFKKKDGYKRTREIARSNNYYIQDYCGCLYSMHTGRKTK